MEMNRWLQRSSGARRRRKSRWQRAGKRQCPPKTSWGSRRRRRRRSPEPPPEPGGCCGGENVHEHELLLPKFCLFYVVLGGINKSRASRSPPSPHRAPRQSAGNFVRLNLRRKSYVRGPALRGRRLRQQVTAPARHRRSLRASPLFPPLSPLPSLFLPEILWGQLSKHQTQGNSLYFSTLGVFTQHLGVNATESSVRTPNRSIIFTTNTITSLFSHQ